MVDFSMTYVSFAYASCDIDPAPYRLEDASNDIPGFGYVHKGFKDVRVSLVSQRSKDVQPLAFR